jgi:hypothetical protein
MSKPIHWIIVIAVGITAYIAGTRAEAAKHAAKKLTRR